MCGLPGTVRCPEVLTKARCPLKSDIDSPIPCAGAKSALIDWPIDAAEKKNCALECAFVGAETGDAVKKCFRSLGSRETLGNIMVLWERRFQLEDGGLEVGLSGLSRVPQGVQEKVGCRALETHVLMRVSAEPIVDPGHFESVG